MKKYIFLPVILFAALALMPQITNAQSTYLDPFANYQRLEIYQQRELAKRRAGNNAANNKPAAKSKAVELELKNNKIREGMTQKEFLAAGEVGKKYFKEGDIDKAQIIFGGLGEIDSGNVDLNASIQEALGIIFYVKQDYDKALSHFGKGLNRNNRMVNATIFRAKIYLMREDYYNAESDLEFFLEVIMPKQNNVLTKEARKMLGEAKSHIYK